MTFNRLFTLAVLCFLTIISSVYGADTILFKEDFDGLKLGPSIKERIIQEGVWTNQPPTGWTIKNQLAAPGMPEWDGWAFANGEWWTLTAEDQERSKFTGAGGKAVKTIAIADPDEWDDLNDPDSKGTFNSWLSTPAIDISKVAPNSMIVKFDSSLRPEPPQVNELTVAFDGGDKIVLVRMEAVGTDNIYKEPHNKVELKRADKEDVNLTIEVKVPNPVGAKKAIFTWAVIEAKNNWWWAIDNISIRTTSVVSSVNASGKLSTLWGSIKMSE